MPDLLEAGAADAGLGEAAEGAAFAELGARLGVFAGLVFAGFGLAVAAFVGFGAFSGLGARSGLG